jgi:hypothetical protein
MIPDAASQERNAKEREVFRTDEIYARLGLLGRGAPKEVAEIASAPRFVTVWLLPLTTAMGGG